MVDCNYSNQLKLNNKHLKEEDPKLFNKLLDDLVIISENFHYFEKQESTNLLIDFLNDTITTEDFSYSFIAIYEGISEMERNESIELAKFLYKSHRDTFNNVLLKLYSYWEGFDFDSRCSKKKLKKFAKIFLNNIYKIFV